MSKTIKHFLEIIAEKAGLKDNQDFQMTIGASGLNGIELPDQAFSSLSSLMNEAEAITFGKTNLSVKNHHIGSYSDGFLSTIRDKAKDFGLSPELLSEFDSTKNTGDKIKLVLDGLNGLVEKAKTEGGKGKSDEYIRQVSELQTKIQTLEADSQKRVNETVSQYKSRLEKLALNAKMAFQWNKDIPEIARQSTYNSAIEKELSELGGKLIFDEEKNDFRVVQKADETLPLVKDAKPFEFSDLHSLTLQKHNLLNKDSGSGGNDPNPTPFRANSPTELPNTSKAANYVAKSLSAFDRPIGQNP